MIYVYRLPFQLAQGYCFHGGNPITFQNVDWFNDDHSMTNAELKKLIRGKSYAVPGKYLVLREGQDFRFTIKDKV